jgi:protein involved in polysaccharide export with SLBB domain
MLLTACCLSSGGCAALTNPVYRGVPVRHLPAEYLAPPKEDLKTIPLTTLRQNPPEAYLLAKGDILGIYIEGVLGDKAQPLPVRFPEQGNILPTVGYPTPVREDGTLPLPIVNSVKVDGMTVAEAEAAIRKAYTVDRNILKAGNERIIVSLVRQRTYRVQVVRQDAAGPTAIGGLIVNQRRGTGATVDLPAYENDVLTALNRTGGLPGLDALNEVIVQREVKGVGTQVTRIPLRLPEGQTVQFSPKDVVLENGDVVFVEARDTEVFYTGGVLQAHQFVLPRDYDLRVVEAIALSGGPLVNGLFAQSNLTGAIAATGIGSPNPSRATILRRTKNNGLIPIIVDLNVALNDPRENIILMPGDVLVLQETVGEAVTRWAIGAIRYNFFSAIISGVKTNASVTGTGP